MTPLSQKPTAATLLALTLSAGMFGFSAWIYLETRDWVPVVFMVGSGVYGVLFAGGLLEKLSKHR